MERKPYDDLINSKYMKTVLITGIAGLLGSRLADWIVENHPEYDIIGIDDLSGGYEENINHKVTFYNINLNNSNELKSIFKKHQPTHVFHFAAYAAEGLSPFIRTFNYQNNLVATANVVNECIRHDVKRLVFTSTMAVYGHGEGGIFHEDMRRNPIDPYGVAKAAINLGGIHEYTINEAADTLLEVFGGGSKVYLEGRHEVHTAIPTFQKSIDILGFKHKTNLKEGLTKMWYWAQIQPKRERFIWKDYELDKGIYSFWKTT